MLFGVFVGGCCGARNRKTIIGGWGWAWWLVTDVQTYVSAVVICSSHIRSVLLTATVPCG